MGGHDGDDDDVVDGAAGLPLGDRLVAAVTGAFEAAGFGSIEVLTVAHEFFRFYRLVLARPPCRGAPAACGATHRREALAVRP